MNDPPLKISNCGASDSHNFGTTVGYRWAITSLPDIRCGIGLMIWRMGSSTIGSGTESQIYTGL